MTNFPKEKIGWVLYDFANSAFHLMTLTVLYPLFYREVIAKDSTSPDFLWSMVIAIPILLVGLSGPVIGAYVDFWGRRKRLLIISSLWAVIGGGILGLFPNLSLLFNSSIFISVVFCFHLSLFIYDAFLPAVSGIEKPAFLSGIGWGLGYIGGLISMIPVYPILKDAVLPGDSSKFALAMIIISGYYILFSIPSWIMLKEPKARNKENYNHQRLEPLLSAWQTIKNWRNKRNLFTFLFGYYLVADGLATLVFFTAIYAKSTLGMTSKDIMIMFVIVQAVGAPSCIFGGWIAEKIGYLKVLLSCVIILILLSIGFAFADSYPVFYSLAIGTGLTIGTTPAIARAIFSRMVTIETSGEMFGFNALCSRLSAVLGPIVFGIIASLFSQRLAIASLAFFFIIGFLILRVVRDPSSVRELS